MEVLLQLLFSEEEREVYRKRYEANNKHQHQISEYAEVAEKETFKALNEVSNETIQGVRVTEEPEPEPENSRS